MVQKLNNVLNASSKSELRQLNESFLNRVGAYEPKTLTNIDETFDTLKVDYKNGDMKRRAQTIATAYRIATQIQLAITFSRWDLINTLMENMEYFENPTYLERNDVNDINIVQAHANAIVSLENLAQGRLPRPLDLKGVGFEEDTQSFEEILADISVTFAWVETYYVTTFFPQDREIMLQNSDTHKKLVQEVLALLDANEPLIELIAQTSNNGKELYFGTKIYSKTYNIEGTHSIISGNTVIELKTTGAKPTHAKILKDANHMVGLHELENNNEDTHTPFKDLYKHILFYPRYKSIVDIDIVGGKHVKE